MNTKTTFDQPCFIRIRVQGNLGEAWADYFYGMNICCQTTEKGTAVTELTGRLSNLAMLQDVLSKLYNLGFILLSAERIELA